MVVMMVMVVEWWPCCFDEGDDGGHSGVCGSGDRDRDRINEGRSRMTFTNLYQSFSLCLTTFFSN